MFPNQVILLFKSWLFNQILDIECFNWIINIMELSFNPGSSWTPFIVLRAFIIHCKCKKVANAEERVMCAQKLDLHVVHNLQ